MDQLTTELVSLGSNGVIIAAILSAFKAYENRSAKKNGGSSARIESLERKIDDLCNEFRLFREEVKLRQVREDTLREVSNG